MYRWDIETNYGYGWGVECSEYSLEEAERTFREYRENVTGRVRMRRHRIPDTEYPTGREEISSRVVFSGEPDMLGSVPNYNKFRKWKPEEVLVWLNVD